WDQQPQQQQQQQQQQPQSGLISNSTPVSLQVDTADTAANGSNAQDWAQYYQSLEAYHSQTKQSQQQNGQQQTYGYSSNDYSSRPLEDYSPYPQWYYQGHPQQQQQPPTAYANINPNPNIRPNGPYSRYRPPTSQPPYSQYSYNQDRLPLQQTPRDDRLFGHKTDNTLPNGGYQQPLPNDLDSSSATLATKTSSQADNEVYGSATTSRAFVDSRRSSSATRGVTRGVSDITLYDKGNRALVDLPWRQADTGKTPLYTPVKLSKKKNSSGSGTNAIAIKAGAQTHHPNGSDIVDLNTPSPEWPDSLKRFVERSFAACSVRARSKLETQLKQIISSAASNKKLRKIDWDGRQLPKACDVVLNDSHVTLPTKRSSGSAELSGSVDDFDSEERKERRLRRFQQEAEAAKKAASDNALTLLPAVPNKKDVFNWDADTIVGTCTRLEKSYLRLTSAPDPSQVRPLPILHKTLDLLKRRWVEENNYTYICNQFKSLRQDLTVQRITNDFTVEVYELHARIALETNDLGEYNQCQTQLKQLYTMGLSGHQMEFLAYRILYFLYTQNKADINTTLATMRPDERQDPAVKHALDVRAAMATGNSHAFFNLYANVPNMGGYLMDNFIDRERCIALQKLCKAFRPKLSVTFITKELALGTTQACIKFLAGLAILPPEGDQAQHIDMKAAYPYAAAAMKKYEKVDIKGQIY
ncbi:hypothetical protein IW140_000497, partial [Coemansia sp. RSA 1813]